MFGSRGIGSPANYRCDSWGWRLEAAPGFEPGDKGFAVLCLTTWLCRHLITIGALQVHRLLWCAQLCIKTHHFSHQYFSACLTCPPVLSQLREGNFTGGRTDCTSRADKFSLRGSWGNPWGSSLPCGLETKKSGHLIKVARMHTLWLDRSP